MCRSDELTWLEGGPRLLIIKVYTQRIWSKKKSMRVTKWNLVKATFQHWCHFSPVSKKSRISFEFKSSQFITSAHNCRSCLDKNCLRLRPGICGKCFLKKNCHQRKLRLLSVYFSIFDWWNWQLYKKESFCHLAIWQNWCFGQFYQNTNLINSYQFCSKFSFSFVH